MNAIQEAADLARLLGDPVRLMLMQALVRREAPVSELLAATGTTQSNLSNHIRLLREHGIIDGSRHGRQIVYSIATPAIAELVEALLMAVGYGDFEMHPTGPLAGARTCYDHLAGRLGVALLEGLAAKSAIEVPADLWRELELGPDASQIFGRLGVDLNTAVNESTRRRFAYACPDWSENGHYHIGGLVGAELCKRCLTAGWIERDKATRVVKLTNLGEASLDWLINPVST